MQWALMEQPRLPKKEMKLEVTEASLLKEHDGFSRVAHVLKLAEEQDKRSLLQIIFDYVCKRMLAKL